MKDEGIDGHDWLFCHRGQPDSFTLAFILNHEPFILHPSSFIL